MTRIIYTNNRSKRKPANTAAKRQLAKDWEDLKKKWENPNIKTTRKNFEPLESYWNVPANRPSNHHIASLNSGIGNATLKPKQEYTGTLLVGIGQLHKSNAVPIFKQEDAIDIARMRR